MTLRHGLTGHTANTRRAVRAFAAIAAVTLFAAVAHASTPTRETLIAESPTLRKIAENNTIVLGARESSVPFSYLDPAGRPIGYSQAIASRIVDSVRQRLGLRSLAVKYEAVTSANRLSYVVNNQVDLECGTTAHVKEREALVAFSNSIFQYSIRMAVKRKSGIRDYADLAGKTVVTTAGTSDERILRQMNMEKNLNLRIISARDHAEAFQALKSDRAVAFVMDDTLLYGKIAQEGATRRDYVVTGEPLSYETYACMMRKGDPVFTRIVDDVIAGMQLSGEAAQLYDTWFMKPIPPDGVNMQFPMSPEMKALFASPNARALN